MMSIEPGPDDIGRAVIYTATGGWNDHGVITSLNEHFVFVRYHGETQPKATRRGDLHWQHPGWDGT